MHVDDGFDDISEVLYGFAQGKRGDFVEIIEESAAVHVLDHKVDVFFFLEEAVELYDVGVIEAGMKANLSAELVHHLVFDYLALHYLLYSCNKTSIVVSA